MKVDGLKQQRWKVSKFQRITEDGLQVDGLRILISGKIKVNGPKVLKGAVQEFE